ncbi:MAG: Holliday junction branch migration protein RuvA [Planctomycetes bacterium]|nr:Holliday junction branch migration protein RuvA [Planctomycetota bacterium]
MYDHLSGEVCEAQGARVVLRTGDGVGYEIKVPVRVAAGLQVGARAQLYTILHVVDSAPTLLGFASRDERELARRLLAVSGVGPSIALAILSTYQPTELAGFLTTDDTRALQRVKGVGAKTAERLCLELRDRVARLELAPTAARGGAAAAGAVLPPAAEDAVMALVTLGYAEADARKRVERARADAGAGDDTGAIVRRVLRG